jgi:hypothetical protein
MATRGLTRPGHIRSFDFRGATSLKRLQIASGHGRRREERAGTMGMFVVLSMVKYM